MQRTISNSGTANWTAGSINSGDGAVFHNSGTFATTFGGILSYNLSGGASGFVNSGLFHKAGQADQTTMGLPFTNTGTVRVDAGNILFTNQGVSTGRFEIAAGSSIDYGSGSTHTLGPGAVAAGAGAL